MRVGIVCLVAAIAFAGGTFLGREYPSDAGVARWFSDQPGMQQALDDLDMLDGWFSPTATPTP